MASGMRYELTYLHAKSTVSSAYLGMDLHLQPGLSHTGNDTYRNVHPSGGSPPLREWGWGLKCRKGVGAPCLILPPSMRAGRDCSEICRESYVDGQLAELLGPVISLYNYTRRRER